MRRTFLLGSAAALLSACAGAPVPNAPVPVPFERDESKVIASADHWQQMARMATKAIHPALDRSVDVQAAPDTQFGRAFHGLLVSALTEAGVRVSDRPGSDRVVFSAQRVRHPLRNMHATPVEQLDTGLWVRRRDGRPILPQGVSELVLTVSVMRGGETRTSVSEVFYVAGGDEWLYELPPRPRPPRPPFPVVYR